MNKISLSLGGIAILVVAVIAVMSFSDNSKQIAYSTGDPNAPKIEVLEKNFDFGKITLSDVAKHEFKIKNIGKNPLIITGIRTSCHCTTAMMKVDGQTDSPEFSMGKNSWQEEIAPEQEAIIEAIYKPATMPIKGQVSRVITFTTNDPTNKEVQLEVVANVE